MIPLFAVPKQTKNTMKNSLYIAKLSGIKIFIHWTFFILILWIIGSSINRGYTTREIVYSVAFVLAIFFCVVLHELGHALTAKRFNYKTKDIILLPIGGMARMEEFPDSPKQEFLIAIAGPLVNVVIAAITYPFINWSMIPTENMDEFVINGNSFLASFYSVNVALVLFNLIPAFPMDGGRIFRAILAMRMNRAKATGIAARTGQIIAVFFCIFGIFYNPFLVLIGIFIFITAQLEHKEVATGLILQNFKVKDVVSRQFYKLEQSAPVKDAAKLLLDVQATDFLVTNNGQVVGTLDRDNIIEALTEKGETAKIEDVMNNEVKFTTEDVSLDKLFKEFRVGKTTIMPVIKDDQVIGTLDLNNILELILIETAIHRHETQMV